MGDLFGPRVRAPKPVAYTILLHKGAQWARVIATP